MIARSPADSAADESSRSTWPGSGGLDVTEHQLPAELWELLFGAAGAVSWPAPGC